MSRGNGAAKSWLLWVNTALTAGAAFIGTRLWDKLDRLNDQEIRYEEKVKLIDESIQNLIKKNDAISREHHAIFLRLDKLDKVPKP